MTAAVAKSNKEVNVQVEDEVVEEYWVDTSGREAAWCEYQGDGDWYGPEWCQEWCQEDGGWYPEWEGSEWAGSFNCFFPKG